MLRFWVELGVIAAALLSFTGATTHHVASLWLEELRWAEDSVMVIVAARDLQPGVEIREEDLYAIRMPMRRLPEGTFVTPDHLLGRVPHERILANELVRSERLVDLVQGTGLDAAIPRGMRAITIPWSNEPALSPGNTVDVLLTAGSETRTVLRSVTVLTSLSGSVTLLVEPDEAETLAKAERAGELTLALRSDLDGRTPLQIYQAPTVRSRDTPATGCRLVREDVPWSVPGE